VSRVLADALSYRDALYYIMTGDPFDGKKAAELKLVNFAVPKAKLKEETVKLAKKLMEKNPQTLRAAKEVYKFCRTMDYAQAEDYMSAKGIALRATDPEKGREEGTKQFLDDKSFRPGLGAYQRKKS
jgi:trans-feruloyl-CoA hydratase/vanillin synthase